MYFSALVSDQENWQSLHLEIPDNYASLLLTFSNVFSCINYIIICVTYSYMYTTRTRQTLLDVSEQPRFQNVASHVRMQLTFDPTSNVPKSHDSHTWVRNQLYFSCYQPQTGICDEEGNLVFRLVMLVLRVVERSDDRVEPPRATSNVLECSRLKWPFLTSEVHRVRVEYWL